MRSHLNPLRDLSRFGVNDAGYELLPLRHALESISSGGILLALRQRVILHRSKPVRRRRGDIADLIAYLRIVKAFATRIISAFALIAALTWIVFPAVVFASTSTSHAEGDACPCCDGAAAPVTIIACPGCQAAAPADIGLSIPYRSFSAAWLGAPGVSVTGIDPVPAEPPPR